MTLSASYSTLFRWRHGAWRRSRNLLSCCWCSCLLSSRCPEVSLAPALAGHHARAAAASTEVILRWTSPGLLDTDNSPACGYTISAITIAALATWAPSAAAPPAINGCVCLPIHTPHRSAASAPFRFSTVNEGFSYSRFLRYAGARVRGWRGYQMTHQYELRLLLNYEHVSPLISAHTDVPRLSTEDPLRLNGGLDVAS